MIIRSRFNVTFSLIILLLSSALIAPTPAKALEDYKKLYLEGLELREKGQFEKAVEAFTKAIEIKDMEKKKIRFYGMRYGEYYPHREKGIAHFELQQYREAYTELEKSLNMSSSKDAEKYLAMAQMELEKLGGTDVFGVYEIPKELQKIRTAREDRGNLMSFQVATLPGHKRDNEFIKVFSTRGPINLFSEVKSHGNYGVMDSTQFAMTEIAKLIAGIPPRSRAEDTASYQIINPRLQ